LPREGLWHQKLICPYRGVSIFPKDSGKESFIHPSFAPFGHTCFLDKRRYFCGVPQKYLQALGLDIFGEKRKELST